MQALQQSAQPISSSRVEVVEDDAETEAAAAGIDEIEQVQLLLRQLADKEHELRVVREQQARLNAETEALLLLSQGSAERGARTSSSVLSS